MSPILPAKRETAVLFVDDDRAFVARMTAALSLFGYRCFEAASGESAIHLFERERSIRIVLTSLRLPGMSGLELIRKLNSWSGDRQVASMLIADSPSLDDAITALRYGAADFLQKPLSFQEIRLSLRQIEMCLIEPAIGKPAERPPNRQSTLRHLVLARNERVAQVESGEISDIAWHMLLEIALGEECSQPVSITNLCMSTGAPINTALRHLANLERHRLVNRVPGPDDKRTTSVHLTPMGLKLVDDFLGRFARRCRLDAGSPGRSRNDSQSIPSFAHSG